MEEVEAGSVTGAEEESVPLEEETPASTEEAEASTESDSGPEEGEEAEPESRAQERIRELANKNRELEEKFEAMNRKLEEERKYKQPPPDIDVERLNGWLAQSREKIEDLRMEGKHLDADLMEEQRRAVLADYRKHQEESQKFKTEQEKQKQLQSQTQAQIERLEEAASLYAKEMKIPEDVWNKGAQQWKEMREANPLLDREYADIWNRQGEIAAIRFAHEKIQGAQEAEAARLKAEKAKKESGKVNVSGNGSAPKGIASFDQLMGLGTAQVVAFKKNNPKRYQELLDKKLNA